MLIFVLFLLGCCVFLVRGFLFFEESIDGRFDYIYVSIIQVVIYYVIFDVIVNVISLGKYNVLDFDMIIIMYFGN